MDELNQILEMNLEKVKAKAFAEGWNACLEEMPKIKTFKGFIIVDSGVFYGENKKLVWDGVCERIANQMLESLKEVIKYTIQTNESENTVTIHGRILVAETDPPPKKVKVIKW